MADKKEVTEKVESTIEQRLDAIEEAVAQIEFKLGLIEQHSHDSHSGRMVVPY